MKKSGIALVVVLLILVFVNYAIAALFETVKSNVVRVNADLRSVSVALEAYMVDWNVYADNLSKLSTPVAYISSIPKDPFAPGAEQGQVVPLNYLKKEEKIYVYSYGPDKDNDDCEIAYDSTNGTESDGDIYRVNEHQSEKQIYQPSTVFEDDQIAKADENNGIKEYMLALKKAKINTQMTNKLNDILKKGWSAGSNDIIAFINDNQESMDLIHKGSQKPYAKVVMDESKMDCFSPVPNFLAIQTLSKAMVAQGKKFESEGNVKDAVRNYIDVIKFGKGIGHSPFIIGKLIDIAVESMGYKALVSALLHYELDSVYLTELQKELAEMEKRTMPISDTFWNEHLMFVNTIEKQARGEMKTDGTSALYLRLNKDRIIENNTKFWKAFVENSKKHYPEMIKFDPAAMINEMDAINRMGVPNFLEASTRDFTTQAWGKSAQIIVALKISKVRTNAYPPSLGQIKSTTQEIPVDPFSNTDFKYMPVSSSFILYSIGPDIVDERGQNIYDPTNGTRSSGDIVFTN